MGTVIAINGKGGTGKTTFAALLVDYIATRKLGSILAVDADPNSVFPALLGVEPGASIVGAVEEISKHMDRIPPSMTKDVYIEMKVQESLAEHDAFDLLVMGRPEGPGCYCYVNNLLRDIMGRVTKGYGYVVIDNAAGMEHISRRTMRSIDNLVLVSDYSAVGVRSCRMIHELAKELGIKMRGAYLVVNRVTGPIDALDAEIRASGLEFLGAIPFSDEVTRLNIESRPAAELKDPAARQAAEAIFARILAT